MMAARILRSLRAAYRAHGSARRAVASLVGTRWHIRYPAECWEAAETFLTEVCP